MKVNKGWKKTLSIIGVLVLCFVIYDTFVTTSLLVMLGILVFSLFYTNKNKSLMVFFSIPLLLALLFMYKSGFFISILNWIMPLFEGTAVESKLVDMISSINQGQLTGGTLTGRQYLHAISWNSFLQNPLFGTSVVGEHSSLLDRMGGMGLAAALPFVMIFISFIRRMVKLYETKMSRVFFWAGTIAAFMFLYEKGNWGCESWIMYLVLMPMGIWVLEDKKNGVA